MNPLHVRLAAVRRRLRFIITFRGLCRLLTLVLSAILIAGWLDWRIALPGLVRAILLAAILLSVGVALWRWLLRPLAVPTDDLSLALRIETLFPFLHDSLTSTVQFLARAAPADVAESPSLREEVVRESLRRVRHLDFHRVVDRTGARTAELSVIAVGALAIALVVLHPAVALTALDRLANPFSGRDWPRRTRIEIDAPSRVARGETIEIKVTLHGEIPAQAFVEWDGIAAPRQTCNVLPNPSQGAGLVAVRRERVERPFRFQVRANDAVSPWHEIVVVPPPALVPRDGRPSPWVRLRYPAYTDLPEQDLPDGAGNVDAVAGTVVIWRAASDRPIARAWIDYLPEPAATRLAASLATLGWTHPLRAYVAALSGHAFLAPVPVQIDPTGHLLHAEFAPHVSGAYVLHLEDDTGLVGTRLFDLRIFPDPAPTVTLERPAPARDTLSLLPTAAFPLHATAADLQYAVRSMYLEYHTARGETPRRLTLYDDTMPGTPLSRWLAAVAGGPLPIVPQPAHVPNVAVERQLALSAFRGADGASLKDGDVLTLQVCADDFDDITANKTPGRSHEVEIRIVGRPALDALLSQAENRVQQEIAKLRGMQQESLRQVIGPEQRQRDTGRLEAKDIDQLLQAEQTQQQIRTRVGTSREGLQAEVDRTLRAMRDNHLPRSPAQERLETVANELNRLAGQALPTIEPLLTRARQEKPSSGGPTTPPGKRSASLTEARRHQEEVDTTLAELQQILEPWGNLSEFKRDARGLLRDQQRLSADAAKLDREETRGKASEELLPEQRAALDSAAERQSKLAERAAELVGKLERRGQESRDDVSLTQGLRDAARQGRDQEVADAMKQAGQRIRSNQMQDAKQGQQKAMKALEAMLQSLDDRREQSLDMLRKKLHEAESKLADIARRQDELRKKAKDASALADAREREQELQRLTREQEQLQKEVRDLVNELTRLRMERAARAAHRASEQMSRTGQQMGRGDESDNSQNETLDRLEEARQAVRRAEQEAEEELAREKLAKVADRLQRLKERQDGAVQEAERISTELARNKSWDRGLLISLRDLGENQQGLAEETEALARERLSGAPVFARLVSRSAKAMKQASEGLKRDFDQARENPNEPEFDANAPSRLREAGRRLRLVLEALQQEKGGARTASASASPDGDAKTQRSGDDALGFLSQLKGLKILQQDVHQRAQQFSRHHPDTASLNPTAQRELDALTEEQGEIRRLLETLTQLANTEGNQP